MEINALSKVNATSLGLIKSKIIKNCVFGKAFTALRWPTVKKYPGNGSNLRLTAAAPPRLPFISSFC